MRAARDLFVGRHEGHAMVARKDLGVQRKPYKPFRVRIDGVYTEGRAKALERVGLIEGTPKALEFLRSIRAREDFFMLPSGRKVELTYYEKTLRNGNETTFDAWVRDTDTDNVWVRVNTWIDLATECAVDCVQTRSRRDRMKDLKALFAERKRGMVGARYEVAFEDPMEYKGLLRENLRGRLLSVPALERSR